MEDLEELEATSSSATAACSPEEIAQGTEALKKFLLSWSQGNDGEEANGHDASSNLTERQIKRLKTCVSLVSQHELGYPLNNQPIVSVRISSSRIREQSLVQSASS